jgi:hypothetical protein
MALRIILEASGDDYRMLREPQRVEMVVPPAPVAAESGGVHAELRDADDRTLYQHDLSSHVTQTVEVFAPDGAIERVAVPERTRTIMLILPDDADARSLVLVRTPRFDGRGVRSESAPEPDVLQRFSLTSDEDAR